MKEVLGMDRQRSFSFKPRRLLVFSLTICSSIIFIVLFSIWVIKLTPSVFQQTHFQFNVSSLLTAQSLTGFNRSSSVLSGVKGSILIHTQFSKHENDSGFSGISVIGGLERENSEPEVVEEDEENEDTSVVSGVQGPILIDTQLSKSENGSGFSGISVIGGLERKNSEPNVVEEKVEENEDSESFTENSQPPMVEKEVSSDKNVTETSSKKVEIIVKEKNQESVLGKTLISSTRDCDVRRGKWVFDESYPLYTNSSCPFIDEGFNCESNGRPDKGYMKWRWQPQGCDIPRFNATKMLELIRGKRLVFVGDSLNRNQWESMLCMLMGAIRDPTKVYETHGRRITKEKGNYSFRFVDYRCTVEYYVTHFLVHEGKGRVGQKRVQTLRIDSIDRSSSRWKGADILVFNTAHWWSHHKTKAGINYYQEGGQVYPRLDVSTAFRKALTTWASWVDKHINPRKTQVFFRSSAPSHFSGGQWNSGGHCKEATSPLTDNSSTFVSEKNLLVEEVIKQMKTPVTVLNITGLSQYRIDAHPSIYGRRRSGKQYSSNSQDCSHWCLPGVPDSWNEILFAYLYQSKHGLTGF
ncbi:protein trichome birefringence-like 6 [Humulus lupulus]|uniref:protein trichome birefringence-like 6 n=1 Tax=Humulus lupulus TaxID=3486 RepID=UPI002B400949|nr:protein trichome birefringence-like 6 [Humulus lupulus]